MSKNYNNEMTEFTKEYIRSVRMCSYLIEPPASEVIEHLCDEIEHLQARVEELEQERRWIPVSERLPEDSRIYDVAIAGYGYSWTGICVFGKWIGESGKAILGVTHWKYRPQTPKEETK